MEKLRKSVFDQPLTLADLVGGENETDTILKAAKKAGLSQKKVQVRGKKKTYQSTRWVREGETPEAEAQRLVSEKGEAGALAEGFNQVLTASGSKFTATVDKTAGGLLVKVQDETGQGLSWGTVPDMKAILTGAWNRSKELTGGHGNRTLTGAILRRAFHGARGSGLSKVLVQLEKDKARAAEIASEQVFGGAWEEPPPPPEARPEERVLGGVLYQRTPTGWERAPGQGLGPTAGQVKPSHAKEIEERGEAPEKYEARMKREREEAARDIEIVESRAGGYAARGVSGQQGEQAVDAVVSAYQSFASEMVKVAAQVELTGDTKRGLQALQVADQKVAEVLYNAEKAGTQIPEEVYEKAATLSDEATALVVYGAGGTPSGMAEAIRGRVDDANEIVKLLGGGPSTVTTSELRPPGKIPGMGGVGGEGQGRPRRQGEGQPKPAGKLFGEVMSTANAKERTSRFLSIMYGAPADPAILRRVAGKYGVQIIREGGEDPYGNTHVKLPDGRYGFFNVGGPKGASGLRQYAFFESAASNYPEEV